MIINLRKNCSNVAIKNSSDVEIILFDHSTKLLYKKKKELYYICMNIKIEKVDEFGKVLNQQFIKKIRVIFIINKTQLHTPTDCFTLWRDHQGTLFKYNRRSI